MKSKYLKILVFCFAALANYSVAQDSLSAKNLQPLMYSFEIKDGIMVGDGAIFLKQEIANAQFTLLGDYINSEMIPILTAALIPELDQVGYKSMALGIGSISGRIVHEKSKNPQTVVSDLKSLNNKYLFYENRIAYPPIPDLQSIGEANFIAKAGLLDWSIVGFGYESWNTLQMLVDKMYLNLTEVEKENYKQLYQASIDSLNHFYKIRNGDLIQFSSSVKNLLETNDFFKKGTMHPENKLILQEIEKSIQKCLMDAKKMYFEKNERRVNDEKRLLVQELKQVNIDLLRDKVFVKWDVNFISRGLQPYVFYGMGNMLSELANYNGNKSLNIGVMRRYYFEDGQVKDESTNKDFSSKRFKRLRLMGQKEKWVIIDLRPLIQGSTYFPFKYLLNSSTEDLIKRHDLIIIPPMEKTPKPNYD